MYARILVDDLYLRTYWNIKQGATFIVTGVVEYEDGEVRYGIPGRILYHCNFTGNIETVWLKESEVKIRKKAGS